MINLFNKIKRAIASRLIRKPHQLSLPNALFTFTFDDAADSAFITGGEILKKYGYAGTYYISLGLKERLNSKKDFFDHSLLKQAIANGNELGCHTYAHIRMYESNKEEIISDLDKNQKKISELIPGYVFKNFAYPYGEQSFRSKLVVRKRFDTARGVHLGINRGEIDLLNLKSFALEQRPSLKDVYRLIDETIASKGWLIFYTHDIENVPTYYGVTPEFFEKIIAYCHQKQGEVVTMRDAFQKIKSSSKKSHHLLTTVY